MVDGLFLDLDQPEPKWPTLTTSQPQSPQSTKDLAICMGTLAVNMSRNLYIISYIRHYITAISINSQLLYIWFQCTHVLSLYLLSLLFGYSLSWIVDNNKHYDYKHLCSSSLIANWYRYIILFISWRASRSFPSNLHVLPGCLKLRSNPSFLALPSNLQ